MTSFGEAEPYTPEEFAKLQEHWAEYLDAVAHEAWSPDAEASATLNRTRSRVINEYVVARLMSTIEGMQKK